MQMTGMNRPRGGGGAARTPGVDVERVIEEVRRFSVAAPSWALGTGGTRFGRFPVAASRGRWRRSSTTSRR